MVSGLPSQVASIEKEVREIFLILASGFQRTDKIKDVDKKNKQLEELTAQMRDAKRLIKGFDKVMKYEESLTNLEFNKMLNEKKQSLINELNSFVALRKTYPSSIGRREELLGGGSYTASLRDVDVRLASSVANEDPTQTARQPMDGTDKTTESSCEKEQSSKTKDDVDTTRFSTKTGSLKELGCKLATNRFVMLILLLITISLIVTVIVKSLSIPRVDYPVHHLQLEGGAF
ncbi:novel plant SNARE 13 isoform X2 [Physcomitrium patens]|uniref:novel plant SNARE 13 isoform X2 n=1 Tax=Physcomitrium patens TaxID=3218 RepID=UPI000D15AFF5|nr:novel plant SNARE 13-like isoform X2 [Physcomitrium patens]|eukprot:XP_024395911.1 novel plant SNARE 13-like isoform X2 [Physcomitrella patens]